MSGIKYIPGIGYVWESDIQKYIKLHNAFTPDVRAWRFYFDGTESASLPRGNQDSNVTIDISDGNDALYHFRFQIQETGGDSAGNNQTADIQNRKNSGTWITKGLSSGNVYIDSSSGLIGGGSTTNRSANGISDPGTGTFVAGTQQEISGTLTYSLSAGNFTECVFSGGVRYQALSNNDILEYRIVDVTSTPLPASGGIGRITIRKDWSGPVISNTVNYTGSSANNVVTLPPETSTGDLLIAECFSFAVLANTWFTPPGWALLERQGTAGDGDGAIFANIYAGQGNPDFFKKGTNGASIALMSISGAASTIALAIDNSASQTSAVQNPITPSVVTNASNTLVIRSISDGWNESNSKAIPLDSKQVAVNTFNNQAYNIVYQQFVSNGAVGTETFTGVAGQDDFATFTVSIAPFTEILPTGSISETLPSITQSLSGLETFIGSTSQNLPSTTQSATGQEIFTGSTNQNLPFISQTASGSFIANAGPINQNLSSFIQNSSGLEIFTGIIVQNIPSITQISSGLEIFTGIIVQTLPSITQSVIGSVTENISGDITQVLPVITQSASAQEIFSGLIIQILPVITQSASAQEIFNGFIVQTLPAITQSASAQEIFNGSIVQTLPPINQIAIGQEIFSGPIGLRYQGNKGTVFSNDNLTGSVPTFSNSTKLTFAFAFRSFATASSQKLWETGNSTTVISQGRYRADIKLFDFSFKNNAGVDVFSVASFNVPGVNVWTVVMGSIDTNNVTSNSAWVIANGTETPINLTTITPNGIFDFTSDWTIGKRATVIGQSWDGELGYILFSNDFVDFNIAANRRKYVNSDFIINADTLGTSGSGIGVSPLIYLQDPFSSFKTNRGSYGDIFTLTGTFTEGTNINVRVDSGPQILPAITQSVSGQEIFSGNINQILPTITQNLSGVVASNVGSISQILPIIEQTGSGQEIFSGFISQIIPSITQTSSGLEIFTGIITQILPSLIQSASAVVANNVGSISQILPVITQSSSGLEIFTGIIIQILPFITQVLSGTISQTISGSSEQVLPFITQTSSGLEIFISNITQTIPFITQQAVGASAGTIGTISQTLPFITQQLSSVEVFFGLITQQLPSISQNAIGTSSLEIDGSVSQNLASIIQSLSGIEIFSSEINQNLSSINQSLSGETGFYSYTGDGGLTWSGEAIISTTITGTSLDQRDGITTSVLKSTYGVFSNKDTPFIDPNAEPRIYVVPKNFQAAFTFSGSAQVEFIAVKKYENNFITIAKKKKLKSLHKPVLIKNYISFGACITLSSKSKESFIFNYYENKYNSLLFNIKSKTYFNSIFCELKDKLLNLKFIRSNTIETISKNYNTKNKKYRIFSIISSYDFYPGNKIYTYENTELIRKKNIYEYNVLDKIIIKSDNTYKQILEDEKLLLFNMEL